MALHIRRRSPGFSATFDVSRGGFDDDATDARPADVQRPSGGATGAGLEVDRYGKALGVGEWNEGRAELAIGAEVCSSHPICGDKGGPSVFTGTRGATDETAVGVAGDAGAS